MKRLDTVNIRGFFFFGWNKPQEDSHQGNKDLLRRREIDFHSVERRRRRRRRKLRISGCGIEIDIFFGKEILFKFVSFFRDVRYFDKGIFLQIFLDDCIHIWHISNCCFICPIKVCRTYYQYWFKNVYEFRVIKMIYLESMDENEDHLEYLCYQLRNWWILLTGHVILFATHVSTFYWTRVNWFSRSCRLF